jgi:DNA (cytosine-5)-methyltransferase 1
MFVMENVPNILLLSSGRFRDDILLGFRQGGPATIWINHSICAPSQTRSCQGSKLYRQRQCARQQATCPRTWCPAGNSLPYPIVQRNPSGFLRKMRLDLAHGPFTVEAKHRRAAGSNEPILHNHHTKEIVCRRAELISHLAPGDKDDRLPSHLWRRVRPGKWRRLDPERPSHAIFGARRA